MDPSDAGDGLGYFFALIYSCWLPGFLLPIAPGSSSIPWSSSRPLAVPINHPDQ
jgi:hypothetical protein